MALIRWNPFLDIERLEPLQDRERLEPFREIDTLQRQMNRLFDRLLPTTKFNTKRFGTEKESL